MYEKFQHIFVHPTHALWYVEKKGKNSVKPRQSIPSHRCAPSACCCAALCLLIPLESLAHLGSASILSTCRETSHSRDPPSERVARLRNPAAKVKSLGIRRSRYSCLLVSIAFFFFVSVPIFGRGKQKERRTISR